LTGDPAGKVDASAEARLLSNARSLALRCYQCGKCSAGCPMGGEMRLKPHDVMRLVAGGKGRAAAADESIWLCLTCETCSARCPNDCDPAGVIDSLRELGIDSGVSDAPRRIAAFHRAFLAQIENNGRLHEMGMVMDYKFRTGDLMKDVTNAPGMVSRGKLSLRPDRIRGVAEVKRIFEKCGEA
jgi:heterodisulfide reductase subunit C2